LRIEGLAAPLEIHADVLRATAEKFLLAIQEAGRIYRHVAERKQSFVTEVSVDERTRRRRRWSYFSSLR